ncbi:MAG: glycosyltransferase family A protein [Bacteroidota bacterium]
MRIGFNPNKDKLQVTNDFFHQLIIPVYIPNQQGYFNDSFTILKYCLNSLFKTSHSKTYFTIVNNGSGAEVIEYLNSLYQQGKIHELLHTTNIGKLNATLKGISGQNFPLVTITDADVLFLNNWQKETYRVFEDFPKAGAVSPVPSPKMLKHFTSTVFFENIFSSKFKFTKTIDKQSLKMFAMSIGNDNFYKEAHLNKNLTITKTKTTAVVGAAHFVATYRIGCFDNLKQRFSKYSLGGNSEQLLLDKPVEDKGYWRLATQSNHAYHMGNVYEDWMTEVLSGLKQEQNEFDIPINLNDKPKIVLVPFTRFFFKILRIKSIWELLLRYKGLTKEEAKEY